MSEEIGHCFIAITQGVIDRDFLNLAWRESGSSFGLQMFEAASDVTPDQVSSTRCCAVLLFIANALSSCIDEVRRIRSIEHLECIPIIAIVDDRPGPEDSEVNACVRRPVGFEDTKGLLSDIVDFWGGINLQPRDATPRSFVPKGAAG